MSETNNLFTPEQAVAIGQSKQAGITLNNLAVTDDDVREICKNQRLVNVGLEGTKITDNALEYLATLPKLELLFVSDTAIDGSGFVHFSEHQKLSCLWVRNTFVNDKTLQIISAIPKLRTLLIDGTKITFEGLLSIANNTKIELFSESKFTAEQMALFKQTQRNLAKKKAGISLSKEDIENAKNHLLDFFRAMAEWEEFAFNHRDNNAENSFKIKILYKKYATERHHDEDRYVCSGMPGGTYGEHQLVDEEVVSKNRLYIYTDADIFQYRFLMIKQKNGSWRVDDCQIKSGNWQTQGL